MTRLVGLLRGLELRGLTHWRWDYPIDALNKNWTHFCLASSRLSPSPQFCVEIEKSPQLEMQAYSVGLIDFYCILYELRMQNEWGFNVTINPTRKCRCIQRRMGFGLCLAALSTISWD